MADFPRRIVSFQALHPLLHGQLPALHPHLPLLDSIEYGEDLQRKFELKSVMTECIILFNPANSC